MSARTIESWEVDDWLTSVGIDVENDAALAQSVITWEIFVEPLPGEDDDQYLCGLEQSWREHFGPFAPVRLNVYVSPRADCFVEPVYGFFSSQVKNYPLSMQIRWDRELDEREAARVAAREAVPKHLLHAKGPRNKWGGAKGARQ